MYTQYIGFLRWLSISFLIIACGLFSTPSKGVEPQNNHEPSQSPVPTVSSTAVAPSAANTQNPWNVEIVSIQVDHVDFIIYNSSSVYELAPLFNSKIEGEVNGQSFVYTETQISPIKQELAPVPSYPNYYRQSVYQIAEVPPGFFAGKFRITWSIPQTVRPRFLVLTVSDPIKAYNEITERIDLAKPTGSDSAVPVLPSGSQFLNLGISWSVGNKWEITPLGVRKFNTRGPTSGVEVRIQNIGGYTGSFKEDFLILLFTRDGEIIDQNWTNWGGLVDFQEVPDEIPIENSWYFPDQSEHCVQLEPAIVRECVITFDIANASINPLTGENTFIRDSVDPTAPLIDYEGSLLVLRYQPTGEFVVFRVSE